MEWLPISELPKNSDWESVGHWHGPVLVLVPNEYGPVMLCAQLDSDMWLMGPDEHRAFHVLSVAPTHWMPLPTPPAATRPQ